MAERSGKSPEGRQQRPSAELAAPSDPDTLAAEVVRLAALVDKIRGERDELRETLERCDRSSDPRDSDPGSECVKSVAKPELLQGQLREVQRLQGLGVLARTIAHDLNNHLTVILGNCSLAEAELSPDSPIRKRLGRARVAAQQSAGLAEQMQSYSGSPADGVKPIHLPHLLDSMRELMETAVGRRSQFSIEGPPRVPLIEANESQMRQLFFNLITNAGEALAGASGHVWVRFGVEPAAGCDAIERSDLAETRYVFLEVEDDGAGIAAKDLAQIFEPFATSRVPGRGIGLAAVQTIVQSHNGRIRLDSTPGEGTTVRVLFPQAASRNTRRS